MVLIEIKRVGDTVLGLATQCVQIKQLKRPKKPYCANIVLKLNGKLGGVNAYLPASHLPFLAERPTILIGADMTGPHPTEKDKPVICAVVGSLDAHASKYASVISYQAKQAGDVIVKLEEMVQEVLRRFYVATGGCKPERIIYFRSALADSWFERVTKAEREAIFNACDALEEGYQPSLTFLSVQRKHHTRLFPASPAEADRSGNALPGTVIDTMITHPTRFDFYLCSHPGLQGTSRPTHYTVLHDDHRWSADDLQQFCFNLTHLYARCTRSVNMVPPTYYADLACRRARLWAANEEEPYDLENEIDGEDAETPTNYTKKSPKEAEEIKRRALQRSEMLQENGYFAKEALDRIMYFL